MDLVASGAAAPTWLGYLIAAIELFGGLAILFGIKTRWVACALVAWVVIATALGHPFWTMEGAARAANQANFYKNLAITGAGRYSLDHRAVSAPSKAAAASA
jgi:putative oxidoreductase